MMTDKKIRSIRLQIKAMDEATGVFEGYGAVFGNVDSYGDIIVPGAFTNYLAENKASDVKLLWQHNSDKPIGVYESIVEDNNGLLVRGRLLVNEVAQAREAYALLKSGAISGLSIGYSIKSGGATMGADGHFYLKDLKLWEISIVTFPANTQATIDSVKSIETIREFETFLRDVGKFSSSQAKRIAAQGFKAIGDQREVDDELLDALKKLNQILIQGV